ncbi:MAG: hypothetical protein U5L03_05155 [Burkholderiaceae bacterium]|nr:hypothetical protein [Burkholderiaceae bacterium]
MRATACSSWRRRPNSTGSTNCSAAGRSAASPLQAAQGPALRFVLAGDAALSEVLALYAPAQAAAVPPGLTLEAAIRAARPEPVEGDEVDAFGVRLAVSVMDGRRIAKVALMLAV